MDRHNVGCLWYYKVNKCAVFNVIVTLFPSVSEHVFLANYPVSHGEYSDHVSGGNVGIMHCCAENDSLTPNKYVKYVHIQFIH